MYINSTNLGLHHPMSNPWYLQQIFGSPAPQWMSCEFEVVNLVTHLGYETGDLMGSFEEQKLEVKISRLALTIE